MKGPSTTIHRCARRGTVLLHDRFLQTLRREIKSDQPQVRREWVAFFVPLDPDHPDINALSTTSLGPFLMEASMTQRLSNVQLETTESPAPSARRARAGL